MGTQRGQVIWAMHICLESQIPDNPGLSRQDRNVPVQWLKKYKVWYPNISKQKTQHAQKNVLLEGSWNILNVFDILLSHMVQLGQRVVHVETTQAVASIKWGPGRNRVPKKEPKIPSIKWRPLLTLEHAQNTKEVLCKSQENKKTFIEV